MGTIEKVGFVEVTAGGHLICKHEEHVKRLVRERAAAGPEARR